MADINKLKDKIKSTIYPNGKGAINASDHQAMLLDMADGMAETDTKLATLSGEIVEKNPITDMTTGRFYDMTGVELGGEYNGKIGYSGVFSCIKTNVKKGEVYVITTYSNTDSAKAYCVTNLNNKVLQLQKSAADNAEITISEDGVLYVNSWHSGQPEMQVIKLAKKTDILSEEISNVAEITYKGSSIEYGGAAYYDLPLPYNLLPKMVITDIGVAGAVYLKPKDGDKYIDVSKSMIPYTIETEIVAFQTNTTERGAMRVEGLISTIQKNQEYNDKQYTELSVEVKSIRDMVEIEIPLTDITTGQFYNMTGVELGGTYSGVIGFSSIFTCLRTYVKKGEKYTITTYSNTDSAKPYCVVDVNNKVVQLSSLSSADNAEIAISEDGVLYVNSCYSGGLYPEMQVVKLANKTDILSEEISNVAAITYKGSSIEYGGMAYYDLPLPYNLLPKMVITDIGVAGAVYLKPKDGDRYIDVSKAMLPYVIETEIVAFQTNTTERGAMRVEGVLNYEESNLPQKELILAKNELSPLSELSETISYDALTAMTDIWLPFGALKGEEFIVKGMGFSYGAQLLAKDFDNNVSVMVDWFYALPRTLTITQDCIQLGLRLAPNNAADTITISLKSNIASRLDAIENRLSNNPSVIIPKPQLAYVNLITPKMPTSKTDDIHATMVFDDRQGNVFTKKAIINAQGTSSLGLKKKNASIDIKDDNYENSHTIKFGDWVAQDGFHLKAYMLDGLRVKPMAAYDFYESILLTRGTLEDRLWKRLQLPSDISATSNAIDDLYMQIDDGAKNHPSGFPCILSVNGEFYGIYCWQLKKHRDNYHQKKDNAAHIHLDGNISNTLLWEANGAINWNKWAGKEMESDAIQNNDGIEVRNPKKLILVDGSEYDADTNTGELISEDSAGFDSSNANMVRTAAVRANIESLSRRVYSLTQMSKGAEKKAAIAEVFDVYSIIDFIIFGQITGNLDGYKKNWQWVTYDGIKWGVNAYDLDGVYGWDSWGYIAPRGTWIHNDTPPITLVIENYLDEIKERYKELRDKGVIATDKIMQPLVNYVKVVGKENYELEYDKWVDGARDNLWRFEVWIKESIRLTDALMSYNL